MKFKTPISMPCTKEQFEELKPLLEAMGYNFYNETSSGSVCLVTNYCDRNNAAAVLYADESYLTANNRTFIPTYNRDLFLALAAMTDEPNGIAGEWWVRTSASSSAFKNGRLYKATSPVDKAFAFIDDFNDPNGVVSQNKTHFTKASISEIFAHFGVSEGKVQNESIHPEIPQPKPMLELKQIDDNTIEYNGKLFKHTGEDVPHPFYPFPTMKDETQYTIEHCKSHNVAIKCDNVEEFDKVRSLFGESEIGKEAMNMDYNCIAHYKQPFLKHQNQNYYRHLNYTIIPAATFIAHNTPK